MTYISKGAALVSSGRDRVAVNRCGCDHILSGDMAEAWLAGRFGAAAAHEERLKPALERLEAIGLAEVSDAEAGIARYRLLTNCVICLAAPAASRAILSRKERWVLKWLRGAGFKLQISELVLLLEKNTRPEPSLLGKGNWQNLVDMLYTTETIPGGILDTAMERSPARNAAVSAVLGLLRKKRILLV